MLTPKRESCHSASMLDCLAETKRNGKEMNQGNYCSSTYWLISFVFLPFSLFPFLLNSWMKSNQKFSQSFTWHQGPHLSKLLHWPCDMRVSISLQKVLYKFSKPDQKTLAVKKKNLKNPQENSWRIKFLVRAKKSSGSNTNNSILQCRATSLEINWNILICNKMHYICNFTFKILGLLFLLKLNRLIVQVFASCLHKFMTTQLYREIRARQK